SGNTAEHIDADAHRRGKLPQLIREPQQIFRRVKKLSVQQDGACNIDGAHPVNLLGNVDADKGGHELSPSRSTRQPFLAGYALHSDPSQSLISGRKGRAERGEMPPEPS